jgi:hypothetical protein
LVKLVRYLGVPTVMSCAGHPYTSYWSERTERIFSTTNGKPWVLCVGSEKKAHRLLGKLMLAGSNPRHLFFVDGDENTLRRWRRAWPGARKWFLVVFKSRADDQQAKRIICAQRRRAARTPNPERTR